LITKDFYGKRREEKRREEKRREEKRRKIPRSSILCYAAGAVVHTCSAAKKRVVF